MSEGTPQRTDSNKVAVTAIVVGGIIVLACIAAFVIITIAFFANAPWA
jgi:hypothetical protein